MYKDYSTQAKDFNISLFPQTIDISCDIKMSSHDISDLTGKQHKHVMRDIRQENENLGDLAGSIFGLSEYKDSTGRKLPCYKFGKRGAMQLALKYDAKIRFKVLEHIEKLENQVRPENLSRLDILKIATAAEEKRIVLEKTVQIQAPKVAAFDRISTADGSLNITSAAKHLQVRPKDLFRYLSENKWIYRRNGNKSYLAYQNRIQQGVMEHKINTLINGDGIERVYEQARVTPKGLAKLSEAFESVLV